MTSPERARLRAHRVRRVGREVLEDLLVTLLIPAVQAAREAARRTQCINQLKQISLAILNYESQNTTFPMDPEEPGGHPSWANDNHVWTAALLAWRG